MANKNLFGKSRPKDKPYARCYLHAAGWRWDILKLYKSVESSKKDPFARAFCNVISPIVGESGEMGDVYLRDIPGAYEALEAAERGMAVAA